MQKENKRSVTADIIPFASNDTMQMLLNEHGILTDTKILKQLRRIREWQEKYNLRISMHTSHFVILTSPKEDVVSVCKELGFKWVYDYHHERCNPSTHTSSIDILKSYKPDKYHLSSGIDHQIKPPHADYITYEDMQSFIEQIKAADINEVDLVLEAKQKNLAIQAILQPLKNGYWVLKE